MLPTIVSSSEVYCVAENPENVLNGVRIAGILGDQQVLNCAAAEVACFCVRSLGVFVAADLANTLEVRFVSFSEPAPKRSSCSLRPRILNQDTIAKGSTPCVEVLRCLFDGRRSLSCSRQGLLVCM